MLQTVNVETPQREATASEFPRVRMALPDDYPQVMAICRDLHLENGVSRVNWDYVSDQMRRGIDQRGAVIGVIGDVGRLQAAIYLHMTRFWYSDDVILEELFAYVVPSFRKTNNARALIEFGKKCSHRFDVPLLIGIISNQRTEGKIRLYSRRLGPQSGAFFLVNGHTGNNSELGKS